MIELKLENNEVEAILNMLAQGPYAQVKDIIDKIRMQAIPQVQGQVKPTENNVTQFPFEPPEE